MKGETNLSAVVATMVVSLSLISGFLAFFYTPFLDKYGVTSTINPDLTESYQNTTKIIENVSSTFTSRRPDDFFGQVFDLVTIFFLVFKDMILTIPNTVTGIVMGVNAGLPIQFQVPFWVLTLITLLVVVYVTFRVVSIGFKRTDT